MNRTDIEAFYEEREAQYRELNIREHRDGERYIVDCPGCEAPMVLGEGWMGCSIPTCPDCNDTADSWASDPRVSEERAELLAAGEPDVTELVRS
jgi:hypothetical protein